MLRTLWQSVKRITHNNVRFLPYAILPLILFLIPITLNHNSLTPSVAEAFLGIDIVEGLKVFISTVLGFVLKCIAWLIFQITGIIFVIAGKIFDTSVVYSLSGSLYSSFTFINSGWVFIRDLVNSLFIFAVLFVAFKQLLSLGGVDKNLKKTVVNIIIAALLINFSLFFTKAVIDVSNFTSRAIYYTMENKPEDGSESSYGPANALAAGLDIQKLLDSDTSGGQVNEDGTAEAETTQLTKAITYLGGSIVHIVAAIIFFVMAFFFIARILVLIVVMLTSPIFFLSFIINVKEIEEIKNKWKKALIGQAVFPIIFMLIIYIAVSFVNSGTLSGKSTDGSFEAGLGGGASGFAIIINFAIVIYLMIFATKMAVQYSGSAQALGSKMATMAAGAGLGMAAFAGRQSLGRLGNVIQSNKGVQSWASSDNKYKRLVGDKIVLRNAKALNEGTFDVRSSKAGELYGGLGKAAGLKVGAGTATTKTAKADNREIQIKSLGIVRTKEGVAKEATRKIGKVESFDSLGARIASTKSRIGENINNKEYKDYREKLIKEIETTHKDDPEKQKELIVGLVGEKAYSSTAFDKTRGTITAELKKKNLKDSAKAVGDERRVLKEKEEKIEAEKKKPNPDQKVIEKLSGEIEKTKADNTKKVSEAKELLTKKREELKVEQAKGTPNKNVIKDLQLQIKKATSDSKTNDEKLTESLKDAPPSAIKELAARDIVHFKSQLNKAHLDAISSKMAGGGYDDPDDEKLLNDMVRDMRMSGKTSLEVSEWIKAEAMKNTSGFNLNFNNELIELAKNMEKISDPDVLAKNKEEMQSIIRAITRKEVELMEIQDVLRKEILENLNPTHITEYAKRIRQSGNAEQMGYLDSAINDLRSGERMQNKTEDERTQYISALSGEKPPKKKAPIVRMQPKQPLPTAPKQQDRPSLVIDPSTNRPVNYTAAKPTIQTPPIQQNRPNNIIRP